MEPFLIQIMQDDSHTAQMLYRQLLAFDDVVAQMFWDVEELFPSWPDRPADLILCTTAIPAEECTLVLARLAVLPSPAAVAFMGEDDGLAERESACQRLGLRYLGHLGREVSDERLRRMIGLLHNHRKGRSI